jgi:hypothetical protein
MAGVLSGFTVYIVYILDIGKEELSISFYSALYYCSVQ